MSNEHEEAISRATVTWCSNDVDRACNTIDGLREIKFELTEALREALNHYCPGCGFGEEGCATIHHRNCRFLALLEKAEGRKLKLNGEPVEAS